jgi:deazaflavin-dependent oxidoreductase (nitroreductase family)
MIGIMGLIDRPPSGWLRVVFRAPVLLYRVGLGGLLGRRFLYVMHTGRRSGRRRETVLEVVEYDRSVPEAFVVAAWGERSDWYRNITAAAAVEVRVGVQRWRHPQHRVLDTEETVRLLETYRASHPYAWNRLAPVIGFPADPGDPAFREATAKIRSLAFTPHRAAI